MYVSSDAKCKEEVARVMEREVIPLVGELIDYIVEFFIKRCGGNFDRVKRDLLKKAEEDFVAPGMVDVASAIRSRKHLLLIIQAIKKSRNES